MQPPKLLMRARRAARSALPRVIVFLGWSWNLLLALLLAVPVWRFMSRLPQRLSYPFELEWMEGGIVSHIRVVLAGQPLYRAPSLQFTPFIYPPFYYYACAAVAKLVGLGYFAPRLVSALAIVGCFGLLFYWVWRETRDYLASGAAVSLFAATYDLSGRWFDISRADSLLLFFLLLGGVCARFAVRRRTFAVAGVALALAFFTKQNALSIAGPVLLAALLRAPRRGLIASAVFVGVVGLGAVALNIRSHGWFWFYVFDLPAQHDVEWRAWRQLVFDPAWPALAPMILAGLAVACGFPALSGGLRAWPAAGLLVLCAAAASTAARLHTGGYLNVMMPAHLALAFASALAIAQLRVSLRQSGLRQRLLVSALLTLQLALLSFGESAALPSADDRRVNSAILQSLAKVPGPIWCTASSYYPVLAGHPELMTHSMGLVDVFKSKDEQLKARLISDLERELSSGRIRSIVLDRVGGFLPNDVIRLIHANYHLTGHLVPGLRQDSNWPNTGAAVRPDEIWSWKENRHESARGR